MIVQDKKFGVGLENRKASQVKQGNQGEWRTGPFHNRKREYALFGHAEDAAVFAIVSAHNPHGLSADSQNEPRVRAPRPRYEKSHIASLLTGAIVTPAVSL